MIITDPFAKTPKRHPIGFGIPAPLMGFLSPFLTDREKENLKCRDISWGDAASIVAEEQLLPFLLAEMQRCGHAGDVPTEIWEKGTAIWFKTCKKNEKKLAVLKSILDAAEAERLPLMVLKGPSIVELLYESQFGLRPFCDLDLAISRDQVERFTDMAVSLFPKGAEVKLSEVESRVHIRLAMVQVEVHWDLTSINFYENYPAQQDRQKRIWTRAQWTSFPWGSCFVESIPDMTVHLAEHAIVQDALREKTLRHMVDFGRAFHACVERGLTGELMSVARDRGHPSAYYAACVAAAELMPVCGKYAEILRVAHSAPRIVKRHIVRQFHNPKEMTRPTSHVGRLRNGISLSVTNAIFLDSIVSRLKLFRQFLLPTRRFLTQALNTGFSRKTYALYLFLLHPFLLILLVPAIGALIVRQCGEIRNNQG